MSFYNALRVIITFVASFLFVIIIDWPIIADWVHWLPSASLPWNPVLEISMWLYDSISSVYRTLVALISVGMAFFVNLWPAKVAAELG